MRDSHPLCISTQCRAECEFGVRWNYAVVSFRAQDSVIHSWQMQQISDYLQAYTCRMEYLVILRPMYKCLNLGNWAVVESLERIPLLATIKSKSSRQPNIINNESQEQYPSYLKAKMFPNQSLKLTKSTLLCGDTLQHQMEYKNGSSRPDKCCIGLIYLLCCDLSSISDCL